MYYRRFLLAYLEQLVVSNLIEVFVSSCSNFFVHAGLELDLKLELAYCIDSKVCDSKKIYASPYTGLQVFVHVIILCIPSNKYLKSIISYNLLL